MPFTSSQLSVLVGGRENGKANTLLTHSPTPEAQKKHEMTGGGRGQRTAGPERVLRRRPETAETVEMAETEK